MTAQEDDSDVFGWLINAEHLGGGFVSTFAAAALRADGDNYLIMRPALVQIRAKYPKYDARRPVLGAEKICHRCGHEHETSGECGVSMGAAGVCTCTEEVRA